MQVITLNVSVMCWSVCMHAWPRRPRRVSSVSFYVSSCVFVCVYHQFCKGESEVWGGGRVENDPGADTYETGGLIHKHISKAPGPGNLRGKLLTSQPWRPHCLLCMRSCDML